MDPKTRPTRRLLVTGGALAAAAVAAEVEGRAEFKLSGVAVVGALANSVGVRGLKLTAASIVLATIQQDRPGVAVASAVVDTVTLEGFTIRLNVPVLADTRAGWFVVN